MRDWQITTDKNSIDVSRPSVDFLISDFQNPFRKGLIEARQRGCHVSVLIFDFV